MPRLLEAFRLKQLRGMSALPRAWQSIVVWQTLLIGRMHLCGGHCHSIDCFVKSGLQSAGGGSVSNPALSGSLDCSMPDESKQPRLSSTSFVFELGLYEVHISIMLPKIMLGVRIIEVYNTFQKRRERLYLEIWREPQITLRYYPQEEFQLYCPTCVVSRRIASGGSTAHNNFCVVRSRFNRWRRRVSVL